MFNIKYLTINGWLYDSGLTTYSYTSIAFAFQFPIAARRWTLCGIQRNTCLILTLLVFKFKEYAILLLLLLLLGIQKIIFSDFYNIIKPCCIFHKVIMGDVINFSSFLCSDFTVTDRSIIFIKFFFTSFSFWSFYDIFVELFPIERFDFCL